MTCRTHPPPPPKPAAPLLEIGIGTAWLLGASAAIALLGAFLGQSPLAFALAGAVVADVAAGRVGVRWSHEGTAWEDSARAAAFGVAIAFAAAALPVAIGAAVGIAHIELGVPARALGLAVVRSIAIAARDELLYRGIVHATAERAGVPVRATHAFAALAGAAAVAGEVGVTPVGLAFAAASGLLFSVLWRRSPLAALAAHATFLVALGVGTHGGLLDVSWDTGSLAAGARAFGFPGGIAAACALVAAFAAARLAPRTSTP